MPLAPFVGFLLALVRTTSWMVVSPPFNTKMMPRLVKLGTAAAISLAVAPRIAVENLNLETAPFVGMIFMQIATGLVLGFLTHLIFSAFQAAGSLIDLFGGFTLGQSLDPFSNVPSSVFGRFYGMMSTTLLFAINGHLLLIKGFMTSFDAVPLGGVQLDNIKQLLMKDVTLFALSAIEIAGPLLAVFFLGEISLGLLSKAAPQLNILSVAFPFKILLTLTLVAFVLPIAPDAMRTLIDHTLRDGVLLLKSSS